MPKPRVIDSGFFDDLDIAGLTRDERLLMVAIVSRCADDYGRLIAHPAYLRKQAFGYDEDLSIDDVAQMRAHILEHCRNVALYTVGDQEYIRLTNWEKYQKIRYHIASKLPAPPDDIIPDSREITAKSRESDDELGLVCNGSVAPTLHYSTQPYPNPTLEESVSVLEQQFTALSGCKPPRVSAPNTPSQDRYNDNWVLPLQDMLAQADNDVGRVSGAMEHAVGVMNEKKYTIASPQSISAIALSHLRARASPDEPDQAALEAAQAKLEAAELVIPLFDKVEQSEQPSRSSPT